jgi:hypothetical protein
MNIPMALGLAAVSAFGFTTSAVLAATTSNLSQVINQGTLIVDIVDASYVPVSAPAVAFTAKTFSFACQKDADASTGTFGTSTQQIYVKNPDAADGGWSVSIAAASPTAVWDSAGSTFEYDFNDGTGTGCDDGIDADAVGGQLTVNPSAGTLAAGACLNCNTTDVSKGAEASYAQGTLDSITVINAAAGSSDRGDWKLSGVALSQTLPAEQAAAGDYNINMTLSVTAS